MSNIRLILGGLMLSSFTMKEVKKSSLIVSNPQKRSSTKKVKNKKAEENR